MSTNVLPDLASPARSAQAAGALLLRPLAVLATRAGRLGMPVWFALLAFGSGVIIHNSLPYFLFERDHPFLIEKAPFSDSALWRGALYVHVAGGFLCLAGALPMFSRRLLRRYPALHKGLGWTWVLSVLVLLLPTGLFLSLSAKGGLPGRAGFLLTGVLMLYFTLRGLQHVLRRDFKGHRVWMVRSYAVAATALSFRLLYALFVHWALPSPYVLAIWGSLALDLFIVECWLRRGRPSLKGTPS